MLSKTEQQEFYNRLGDKIRLLRDEKSIKQEALASYLGFTRISISNIETGKQKIQLHTLIDLADYMNVPVEEIIPALKTIKIESSEKHKLEKKILNTEISNRPLAVEKIKDFIRLSTSKNSK